MPSKTAKAVPLALALLVLLSASASAQVHHPFAIGATEGTIGHQNALGAWLIAQESRAYTALVWAVHQTKASWLGLLSLVGLSFVYGVAHAVGPGHGKAVIMSYVVSNERALRRGLGIAFCAALLQGVLAIVLVGVAAFMFHATAHTMTQAAQTIEFFSYIAVVSLGCLLCWRKGARLIAALWPARNELSMLFAGASMNVAMAGGGSGRFRADNGTAHPFNCGCGSLHEATSKAMAAHDFDFKAAALAVVTAGARPCSGAILVLVFTLSQGIFGAGVAAALAMALGTAVATGLLATGTVFAKDRMMQAVALAPRGAALAGRILEMAAALFVLATGLVLLAAWLHGFRTGGISG